MGQVHGMVIQNLERRVFNMTFCIQASNPKIIVEFDETDDNLSAAIETIFPMTTEDAIMVWNNIHIPLSYKYDIGYMLDDIINMLKLLRENSTGELKISWLPDTFRSDWVLRWEDNIVKIEASWEDIIGDLTDMLNKNSNITISKQDFIYEWKKPLSIVISGLEKCSYNVNNVQNMVELIREVSMIDDLGILYRD